MSSECRSAWSRVAGRDEPRQPGRRPRDRRRVSAAGGRDGEQGATKRVAQGVAESRLQRFDDEDSIPVFIDLNRNLRSFDFDHVPNLPITMLNRHGLSGLPGVELDNEMLLYRNINLLTKRQGFHPTRPAVGIQFQPLGNTFVGDFFKQHLDTRQSQAVLF